MASHHTLVAALCATALASTSAFVVPGGLPSTQRAGRTGAICNMALGRGEVLQAFEERRALKVQGTPLIACHNLAGPYSSL
jgi:hypothetical protein